MANNAIFTEVFHTIEGLNDTVFQSRLPLLSNIITAAPITVKTLMKQFNNFAGNTQVIRERFSDILATEIKLNLLHIVGVSPQHGNLTPTQLSTQN